MQLYLPYRPFPVHVPFHRTTVREKAGIGAVGSGKTLALCADAIGFGLSMPGARILIARADVPSLKETTELELLNMLSTPPPDGGPTMYDYCQVQRSGGHVDKLYLPNGSEIMFRSLDNWRKIMSYNLAYIGIDEASQIEYEAYDNLKSRLRQQEPTPRAADIASKGGQLEQLYVQWRNPRQQIALVCNPDGHNWIWQHFVDRPSASTRWFRSTSFDNPTFYDADGNPNAYLESLLEMPELWVRRFVLCQFDAFAGAIYAQFDPSVHVHAPFDPVGDEWERGMGMDWGIDNPTAIGWWARRRGTTKWYKYREWMSYDPHIPGSREKATAFSVYDIAQVIHRLEKNDGPIKWRGADPAIFRRQSGDRENETIDYFFRQHGLYFRGGAEKEDPRINAVNQLFSMGNISIGMNCPMTIQNYQQYRYERLKVNQDQQNFPEKARKKDDHDVNADQYFFTLFTIGAPPPREQPVKTWDDMMWDKVRSKRRRMVH